MNTNTSGHKPSTPSDRGPGLWRVIAGLIVWAVAFSVLYVVHGIACREILPHTGNALAVRIGLIVLWLLFLAIPAVMLLRSIARYRHMTKSGAWRPDSSARFMQRLVVLADASSCAAVLASGMPIVFLKVCAGSVMT